MAPQPFSSDHQTPQEGTEDTSALLTEPTGWVLLLGSFLSKNRLGRPYIVSAKLEVDQDSLHKGSSSVQSGKGKGG